LDTASPFAAIEGGATCRRLVEAENTSLARYIWRRRLERAAIDLRDPARESLGISAIAMAHGFNDLSHFSRAFRQRFEMSPRAYRLGADADRVA
jgi:AraC-like DNA-binding protein